MSQSHQLSIASGVVGTLVTHPTVFIGVWKWMYKWGWTYPFYSIAFTSIILFGAGIYLYMRAVTGRLDLNRSLFYLPAGSIFKLSVPYVASMLFTSISIFQNDMTASRYLMLAPAADLFWIGVWSSIMLQRALSMYHWLAFGIASIGYLMFDIIQYDGTKGDNFSFGFPGTGDGRWKGPVYCLVSRMFFVMTGVLSKRLLLKRGYAIKVAEKARYEDEFEVPEDEIDDDGTIKKRIVRPESMLNKRSMLLIAQNLKSDELDEPDDDKKKKKDEPDDEEYDLEVELRKERMRRELGKLRRKNRRMGSRRRRRRRRSLMNETGAIGTEANEEPSANEELEAMLSDYNEVGFHMHLFSGYDDIHLTKVDSIFDNVVYDMELIGLDETVTFELHAVGGGLALFPLAILTAYFNGEMPEAWQELTGGDFDGPYGNGVAPLIVILAYSLLFMGRPYFLHKLAYCSSTYFYFVVNMFCHFFVLLFSNIIIETSKTVPITHGCGMVIAAFAYVVYYHGNYMHMKRLEIVSSMEALKTVLDIDFNSEYLEQVELQLMTINETLGLDALYRIMLDTAISRDPNSLSYTANPVMTTRVLFDQEYFHRVQDWAGGYPRPLVEAIEGTWRSLDGSGKSIGV